MWRIRLWLVAGLVTLSGGVVAAPPVSITVKDLTPKFLTFYRAAESAHLSPDQRFKLWKRDYGFAAVPPTPQGDQIARKLLDAAWPKYPSALTQIEHGAAGIRPSPRATLQHVADLLHADKPVHLTLVAYVGGFEGNAFTVGGANGVTVALPVEESAHQLGPAMTHEFTHAVVIAMGYSSGGWIRTIGETVLQEGLAMRVAQHFYPDRPAKSFVEMPSEPGWLARSDRLERQILHDVKAALRFDKSGDVMRFTIGTGPSGIDREAYYAGWKVIGYWLSHGLTYADIARIPEAEAPARVGAAIDAILREPPLPHASSCRLCLYGPDNMAFDAAGNAYLIDTDHKARSRLLKLSAHGRVLAEWHVFASVPVRYNGPDGIALDREGDIFVVDTGGDQILKLSPTGKVLSTFGGFPVRAFDEGGHVAVGRHGNIYGVAAGPDLIRKFSPKGKLIASWHRGPGAALDQWNQPETISIDGNGNLVIDDFRNARILMLTPSGYPVRAFISVPNKPLNLAATSGTTVGPDGYIYVADFQLRRIQEFAPDGRLLATIGNTPGNVLFKEAPNSIAIDMQGNLYAADGLSVIKFSRDGKLLARWQ